jgi:1-acyl-sn-glycerol-3-phosphate acyltransferase
MYSLLYYLYIIIASPVLFLVGLVLMLLTCLFDRNRTIVHYYSRFWGLQYYWIAPWWKIRVAGKEQVVRGKKYIILSNHQSMLDICLLYKVPAVFKWVSKKEVLRIPFVGWALWLHRDITITRGDRAGLKKMLKEAQDYLSRNISIILFPEGTRSRDGRLQAFKEGAFLLAKLSGTAILPVVISGNSEAVRGWKIKRRQVFRIKILPEIPETEIAALSTKEIMQKVWAQMEATKKELQNA